MNCKKYLAPHLLFENKLIKMRLQTHLYVNILQVIWDTQALVVVQDVLG